MALKLAEDPELLASLRTKLAHNRGTSALFNAERFARHIEAAYTAMWERAQRGEAPESFAVDPEHFSLTRLRSGGRRVGRVLTLPARRR